MNLLPLDRLGAREQRGAAGVSTGVVDFGLLLPGVTPADGSLVVRIIHVRDQFIQGAPATEVPMVHSLLSSAGQNLGYWSATVDTRNPGLAPPGAAGWGSAATAPLGDEQQYVYRYALVNRPGGQPELDDIIDPFAREFGYGDVSSITVGYTDFDFDSPPQAAFENQFSVPGIRDAIVYELNIAELGGDLPRTIGLLDYIADLGVNVIEVMPVHNSAQRIDWGYDPLGYFGVTSRLGRRRDFQQLVARAHEKGMAVVLDSVYGHVEGRFAYARVYQALHKPNPFIGPFADDQFFESTDFTNTLTQDYFFTANVFWLEKFRVDGFRYDDVPEYWEQRNAVGQQGYSDLAQATFDHVRAQSANLLYRRFFPGTGEMRLLQIAEYLGAHDNPPQHVLFDTVSNSTWQNQTMEAAKKCARGEPGALTEFGLCLGLQGFPASVAPASGGAPITKSGLQYLETHDHERFICTFGTHFPDKDSQDPLLQVGDRDTLWFKVQPYLIGLLTARGTPLLWQGQEFCENYFVPDDGNSAHLGGARTTVFRPVDFNLFYDAIGKQLVRLVRHLVRIRKSGAQFRSDDHFFFNEPELTNQGLLLYRRQLGKVYSLVALNVTDTDRAGTFTFPVGGTYTEEIAGRQLRDSQTSQVLTQVAIGQPVAFTVPSNFGCIWTVTSP